MVGSTQWTTGTENRLGVRNYEVLATAMNAASIGDLQTFVDAIRVQDRTLMTAHADAFYGGTLHRTFLDTEATWFGADPMWFWNSELTPDQMHQVMRESRARTCELMLAAGQPGVDVTVRFFLQCGHARFRTVITWDGADPADAGPVVPNGSGVSGQPWTPTRIDRGSEIHVWVFTPYSAGYGDPAQLAQPLYAPRARATDQLLDHLRSMSRDDVQAALTDQVLADLVTYSPGRRIFQGPLAVAPGTGVLPPVDGLRVRFDVFREPFENGAFAAPMLAEPSLSVPTALRSGIEITWQQVNRPPAPNRFAFPEPAPIRVHPLDLVQANIVQPHVRNSCLLLLLRFDEAASGRAFLRDLSGRVKSATGHADDVTSYRQTPPAHRSGAVIGEPYVGVGLSYAAYDFLGVPEAARPRDAAFRDGMSQRPLDDPPPQTWPVQPGAHAIVVIGAATELQTDLTRFYIRALAAAHRVVVTGEERGASLANAKGEGIEHFGYVDGRSQPLYLAGDVQQETETSGTSIWNPARPMSDVLVPDPAHAGGRGTYLVFRKLEQNVRQFHRDRHAFAGALGLHGPAAARAGAMLVGRFEDGTPLALQRADGMDAPVTNDFDYRADPDGLKCPVSSHMRLMNDRVGTPLLARRGVTYGERHDDPDDGDAATKPEGGVGLLFMAFASNLVVQFETLQLQANGSTGQYDPIIGQGQGPRPAVAWPRGWGHRPGDDQDGPIAVPSIRPSVTMLGGEYFFMPSIPALRALP